MARIVVVSADPSDYDTVAQWLAAAGHDIAVIRDFESAKRQLDTNPPDLLVASVRLGAYNGLHLAVRARFAAPPVPVVVIGSADPVLQAEAARLQAPYLTPPVGEEEIRKVVSGLLTGHRPTRRSARKRIGRVAAYLDDRLATVLDVSYEGLRLEVPRTPVLPPTFTVRVPRYNLACRVQRVWLAAAAEDEALAHCGATLAPLDAGTAVAWRAFVDAMPGLSLAPN